MARSLLNQGTKVSKVEESLREPVLTKAKPTGFYATGNGLTKTDELMRKLRYSLNYDPLTELVKLAKSAKTTSSEKIKIASELLSYYQPKLKPMEMNPNDGEVINVNIVYGQKHEHTVPADDSKPTPAKEPDSIVKLEELAKL